MKKREKIIVYVTALLMLLTFMQTCSNKKSILRIRSNVEINYKLLNDTIKPTVNEISRNIEKMPSKNDIKIEGLKSEKRMIQATDRKMLDIKRQSEIDKVLDSLENN